MIPALAIDRPNVGPRPDEALAFGKHDPRPLVIETQAALGGRRDFDRILGIGWWGMGDRQNTDGRCPVLKRRNNGQHESRAILVPPPLVRPDAANARDRNSERPSRPSVQSAAFLSIRSSALR